MKSKLFAALQSFADKYKFTGKGPLCVALVVTQHAREKGLPLNDSALITEGQGQVLGLGKAAVQKILKKHDIERVLAAEGGRTSRGSIGNMREYVAFLNQQHLISQIDFEEIERFWINSVHAFFAGKPFKIKLDSSHNLRGMVRDVILQAQERQRQAQGTSYAGAVLQHLVGAKLECALSGDEDMDHHSFTTADAPTGRSGDFVIGDVAIHITTSPGEAVIQKCQDNLNEGLRPILVTLQKGLTVGEALAENIGIADRIDVFEVEQFIALNLYELGKFKAEGRKLAVDDLIKHYNQIIDDVETDPSLKIEFRN